MIRRSSVCVFAAILIWSQPHVKGLPKRSVNSIPHAGDCNFDNGLCGYENDRTADFRWERIYGSTISAFTGPSYDHTQGAGNSGHYMYIESSNPRLNGDKARLIPSFWLQPPSSSATTCLHFYYHMYGHTIGKLSVYVRYHDSRKDQLLWRLVGGQGNRWQEGSVVINSNKRFKIIFEGETSYSYLGDAAIDDITIKSDSGCRLYPVTAGPKATPSPLPPVPIPNAGNCGNRLITGRVVGGGGARRGQWPWQVMISTSATKKSKCGATLLSPTWIVTAAHCVADVIELNELYVRVGALYRNDNGADGQVHEIDAIYIHPLFNTKSKFNNDVSLLRLKKPAKLGLYVNPACLLGTERDFIPGAICWITGWGRIWDKGPHPSELHQAQLPLVSNRECSSMESYPGRITSNMVCAGYDDGFSDTCEGDSGGPLVCARGGKWYLAGITSWGDGCGHPKKYGVYTRTKAVQQWIYQVMAYPDKHKRAN